MADESPVDSQEASLDKKAPSGSDNKVELRLHAVGDAPIFKRTRWNIDGEKRIEVRAINQKLQGKISRHSEEFAASLRFFSCSGSPFLNLSTY